MPNPPTRVLRIFIQWVVDNSGKNSHFPRQPRQEARLMENLVWNTREHQRTSWSPADALARDSWKAETGIWCRTMQSHARLQLKEPELIGTRKPYRNVSACRLGRVSVKPQSRWHSNVKNRQVLRRRGSPGSEVQHGG